MHTSHAGSHINPRSKHPFHELAQSLFGKLQSLSLMFELGCLYAPSDENCRHRTSV
jgi:hypothetical protein